MRWSFLSYTVNVDVRCKVSLAEKILLLLLLLLLAGGVADRCVGERFLVQDYTATTGSSMVLDDILVLPIANHHGIENLGPQYGDAPDDRHHDDHGLARPHPAVRLHSMPGSRGHCVCVRGATTVSLNDGHT